MVWPTNFFCLKLHNYAIYILIPQAYTTSNFQLPIPYTVLFQMPPDYKFLKVFSCACFPLKAQQSP
jgi:hypothetical protein